jgi:hypothetical protein
MPALQGQTPKGGQKWFVCLLYVNTATESGLGSTFCEF